MLTRPLQALILIDAMAACQVAEDTRDDAAQLQAVRIALQHWVATNGLEVCARTISHDEARAVALPVMGNPDAAAWAIQMLSQAGELRPSFLSLYIPLDLGRD